MTHVKAPTNEGMMTGRIPRERINDLPGIFTRATKYPIGTPIKRQKKGTEMPMTKEFHKLLRYSLLTTNCCNPSRLNPWNARSSAGAMKARISVVAIG